MLNDRTLAIAALRRIAFDAGCALLGQASPETLIRCIDRFNAICAVLRRQGLLPGCACVQLTHRATPGAVRIAARALAQGLTPPLDTCKPSRLAA